MTTQIKSEHQVEVPVKSSFLDKVLRADGIFALFSGTLLVIAASPIANLIAIDQPVILIVLGLVLFGYGAMLLVSAGRENMNRQVAWLAIILNSVWVIASYLGLFLGWFPVNTAGNWAIALVAEAVAIFAILEYIGLRRSRK
jgi:hypothetical protein